MHKIFKIIQFGGKLLFEGLILLELLFFIENVSIFNLLERPPSFFRGFYIYGHVLRENLFILGCQPNLIE